MYRGRDAHRDALEAARLANSQRVNVYLPLTLVQRVEEAKRAGRRVNLSAAAQRGIAAALDGHQDADTEPELPARQDEDEDEHQGQCADIGGRLDAIERTLGRIVVYVGLIVLMSAISGAIIVLSVRAATTN
jgi:hypothetical protein